MVSSFLKWKIVTVKALLSFVSCLVKQFYYSMLIKAMCMRWHYSSYYLVENASLMNPQSRHVAVPHHMRL